MLESAAASLTRHRSFVLFWCARTFTNGAYMMQGVAVGWQIYELTNDTFDLCLVGLVQFVPLVGFSVIIGQVADLYDRRLVVATCQVSKALAALALAVGTGRGGLSRDAVRGGVFLSGTARAFEMPTIHALLPGIVSARLLPRAIAASASAQQTAVICGPSLGGLLYVFSPTGVYATCAAVFIAASVLIGCIRVTRRTCCSPLPVPRGQTKNESRSPWRPCLPASATSAAARSCWARSRSTSSPGCWAGWLRSCRSMAA